MKNSSFHLNLVEEIGTQTEIEMTHICNIITITSGNE